MRLRIAVIESPTLGVDVQQRAGADERQREERAESPGRIRRR
jgi:hypothetical protein